MTSEDAKEGPTFPGRTSEDAKEGPNTLEMCFYCRKVSYTMLKCSWCKVGRYCNKECQRKDFSRHKKGWALQGRFLRARVKIPQPIMFEIMVGFDMPRFTMKLGDMPDEFNYRMYRVGVSILLEIVGPYPHIFRHGAIVRDVDGEETHILFYDPMNIYHHQTYMFPIPMQLEDCLKPGNFILLIGTHWHNFMDGTVGIRVDDLQNVHFVLE